MGFERKTESSGAATMPKQAKWSGRSKNRAMTKEDG
jgi:hypothetical protein